MQLKIFYCGNENPSGHLPYFWGKEDDYYAKVKLAKMTILENWNTYVEEYRYCGNSRIGLPYDRAGYD